jgi:pyruvate/2-oxoglutarate dehydrogenase complex dihydrolipoamide acyltransferase (E2) component
MAIPLHTPRINNNDDTVRLTTILLAVGAPLRRGDPIADIETDKASFTVESEHDGYLLGVLPQPGDTIQVGSIFAWIGSTPDEAVPADSLQQSGSSGPRRDASLKAAMLLSRYGLDSASVPAAGERLSAEDVERYVRTNGLWPPEDGARQSHRQMPPSPGSLVGLMPMERGMLRTVAWHRDEAAAGYVEIAWDPAPWLEYAAGFQKSKQLLMSPLLSLLAWKLVQLARSHPRINMTMVGEARYVYEHVNLGFTVQAGERLYVIVMPEAETLSEEQFVERLGELQRSAMKGALAPAQTSGATIAFSSMARWPVTRHIPLLVPHTAMMVAHTAPQSSSATLGATYDHRVLSGWDVVRVLQDLSRPEEFR